VAPFGGPKGPRRGPQRGPILGASFWPFSGLRPGPAGAPIFPLSFGLGPSGPPRVSVLVGFWPLFGRFLALFPGPGSGCFPCSGFRPRPAGPSPVGAPKGAQRAPFGAPFGPPARPRPGPSFSPSLSASGPPGRQSRPGGPRKRGQKGPFWPVLAAAGRWVFPPLGFWGSPGSGPSGLSLGGPLGPVLASFGASFPLGFGCLFGLCFRLVSSCGVWFWLPFWGPFGWFLASFWLSFRRASPAESIRFLACFASSCGFSR